MTNINTNRTSKSPFGYVIGTLLVACVSCLLFLGIILLNQKNNQVEQIYSGVHVSGYDLSGLTLEEAAILLSAQETYANTGRILLIDAGKSWIASPSELGLSTDVLLSARKAYAFGRDQGIIKNFMTRLSAKTKGVNLPPVMVYNQKSTLTYLQTIAEEIDNPIIEARISVDGAEVIITPGQIGRELHTQQTLEQVSSALLVFQDTVIELKIEETAPKILDVSEAAEQAEKILSKPLTLQLPEPFTDLGPWIISRNELSSLLAIEVVENNGTTNYQVGLDQIAFRNYLSSLAPLLKVEPVNARYIFNDDTRLLEVIESAVIGRSLNVEASLETINDQLPNGNHTIDLVLDINEPTAMDDTSGEELGITELVISRTSYFYGSDPERVQNIAAASKRFHGLLIAPGETFSMADALGDISLDNGYAEALIIVGNQTVKGVGGGVCQVSTTLFRTAFFGGFPIVERHAHAYRVGYYEQRADGSKDSKLAGLDATVYFPLVNLQFTNDTPYWLLMETYMGNYSLTWKFYSTKDGRSVEWETTGLTNIVKAPEPLYKENPDLEKGEIKQIDYAADGAYISVTRIVYKEDAIYFQDTFNTNYRPWQAIYEYGPGTEIPTPAP